MNESTVAEELKTEIRVLIADSTPMGTQLLAESLGRSPRLTEVNSVYDADEVLARLAVQPADVAVLSSDFPADPGRGFLLAQTIASQHRQTRVIMLLGAGDRDSVVQAFRAGCRGVFRRSESVKDLVKSITCVHEGQVWARSEELSYMLEALQEGQPVRVTNRDGVPLLTKREMSVVQCVAQALTNREIAEQLNLSEHTVKNYMFRIFDKLGVSSRVELIVNHCSTLENRGVTVMEDRGTPILQQRGAA